MANESPTPPLAATSPTQPAQAAESLREKGHKLAGAAREGVASVAGKAEAADAMAGRAQEYIADAERRLDAFIDATEKLFARGSQYTGAAKAWLDEHREYREKAEALVQKADDFRQRVRSRIGESGAGLSESGEEIAAGARARLSSYSQRGMQRVRTGASAAGTFVRENPMDTLLIGAAVGVLIGTAYRHMTAEPDAGAGLYEGEGMHGEL
jgi:ElaB/YqjD/DUF883 family membrane-anchored ribosome-binding protein